MPVERGADGCGTAGPWGEAAAVARAGLVLDSFRRLVGRELLSREGGPLDQAARLFVAPQVVVSHGTEDDPVLWYGNAAALALWEMDWETFTRTPSRLTAEPAHRDERARLLERTRRDGYVDDYAGIRVSSTGRRFRIEQAIVWNVVDAAGRLHGQAATFDRWTPLPPAAAVAASDGAVIMPVETPLPFPETSHDDKHNERDMPGRTGGRDRRDGGGDAGRGPHAACR